jgi:penicillin-binding protein 2
LLNQVPPDLRCLFHNCRKQVVEWPAFTSIVYDLSEERGTIFEPRLGLRFERPDGTVVEEVEPVQVGRLPYSRTVLGYIRDALRGVVTTGTAAGAFIGFPLDAYPIAGKTGTAEIKPKQPFSWFAAMAPAGNPKYVVVSVVEEGGHGSTTSAPVVRRILEGLFGIGPGELQSGGVTD